MIKTKNKLKLALLALGASLIASSITAHAQTDGGNTPQDQGFYRHDHLRGATSDFNSSDNSDSTDNSVPDQFRKRAENGQVVLYRFSYREGRWIVSGRKAAPAALVLSPSSTS